MNTYEFSIRQPSLLWTSGEMPPLRMAGDETGEAYVPSGFVVENQAAAPAAPAVPAPARKAAVPFARQVLLLAVFGALCLMAYYAASRYVVTPVVIQGRSMAPTLQDGECYFLNRWVYLFKSPARGDLVVLKDPGHNDFAIKRVIARPGDWLNLKEGKVFLNGERLNEPYLPKGTFTATPDSQEKWIQLGQGQYFVMGDNRSCSEDSRVYGRVLRENILGAIRF